LILPTAIANGWVDQPTPPSPPTPGTLQFLNYQMSPSYYADTTVTYFIDLDLPIDSFVTSVHLSGQTSSAYTQYSILFDDVDILTGIFSTTSMSTFHVYRYLAYDPTQSFSTVVQSIPGNAVVAYYPIQQPFPQHFTRLALVTTALLNNTDVFSVNYITF
jgi:hypothetical protein